MPRPNARRWRVGPKRFSPSPSISEHFAAKSIRALHAPPELSAAVNWNVRYWPKADMPKNAIDVDIGGKADIIRGSGRQECPLMMNVAPLYLLARAFGSARTLAR